MSAIHAGSLLAAAGRSLAKVFLDSMRAEPGRTALEVGDTACSYAELGRRAGRIARVAAEAGGRAPFLGAVLASRSSAAYEGILGALIAGAGYVPLGARFPDTRNAHMLTTAEASFLIADAECAPRLEGLLPGLPGSLLVLLPEEDDVGRWSARHPAHRFVGRQELAARTPLLDDPAVDEDSIACLLFTSGSTGPPKGVAVTQRNVLHFLAALWSGYPVVPEDRVSQSYDLTFDLSILDMFGCWGRRAALYCVQPSELRAGTRLIQSRRLTVWSSVPSAAIVMKALKLLVPGSLPGLRMTLFGGERLPVSVAKAWQAAAPSSIVANVYGPTEVTIAATHHRFAPADETAPLGVVPIGVPFPGMSTAVVAGDLSLLPRGERGELCLKGPQVSAGYWKDAERTRERFVAMPWSRGPDNRWYRTGDVAFVDPAGRLIFCGRNDEQVKLRGYRVELAEIERAVRDAASTEQVAVVPYPETESGYAGVTAFVAAAPLDVEGLVAALRTRLPDYMVPQRIVPIAALPLTANGKVDKRQLRRLLEGPDDLA